MRIFARENFMKDFILLLPIIFIFHDMEELVGFGYFFRKNPWLYERFPKVMKNYKGFTNEGFALGVYEEFIPFFGVSLLAFYFPGKILYALWFGIFLSLLAHFFYSHWAFNLYKKIYSMFDYKCHLPAYQHFNSGKMC